MYRLLVVDDSPFILKIIQDLLQKTRNDLFVEVTGSGEKAIQLIEESRFDLILLDIVMPNIDGYAVLSHVRRLELFETTKVMMITGNSDPLELKKCFEAGATDFITKPINEIEFISRVNAGLLEQQLKINYKRTIQELENKNEDLALIQKQLLETQQHLIQSEQLSGLGFLAAGVAHEINNPLGFIKNNIKVLCKYVQNLLDANEHLTMQLRMHSDFNETITWPRTGYNSAFIKEDLGSLIEETDQGIDRIELIVNQLRNFSGIDQIDEVEDIDLGKNALEVMSLLSGDHLGNIDIETDFKLTECVRVPVGKFNVALISILKNAVQSLQQSNKQVKVIHIITWREPQWICLRIRDSGCGAEPELMNKVFQPFFTTKDVGKGTGLGLTTARNIIVNQLHGTIEFDSQWGEFAEVTIRLPLNSSREVDSCE